MLRPESMSATDTTEDRFTPAGSTAGDVSSLDSDSWPEKWRTLEGMTPVSKVLDSSIHLPSRSAGAKWPQPPDSRTQQSMTSCYEALISIAKVIRARHGI